MPLRLSCNSLVSSKRRYSALNGLTTNENHLALLESLKLCLSHRFIKSGFINLLINLFAAQPGRPGEAVSHFTHQLLA
jgi:hypothetical protein